MTSVNRRAARTKTALREALARLLSRKSYAAIRVQDILAEAGVGRSTFYEHCRGKEDLLRGGLRMLRSELAPARTERSADRLRFSRKLLEHIDAHRAAYPRSAGDRARGLILEELRVVALQLARDELASLATAPDARELTAQFVAGGLMALVKTWLDGRTGLSAAQLDDAFQRIVFDGVRPAN